AVRTAACLELVSVVAAVAEHVNLPRSRRNLLALAMSSTSGSVLPHRTRLATVCLPLPDPTELFHLTRPTPITLLLTHS
ncbi:hypothetical protein BCR44DRAFT_1440103, partial [Catenaria anguillulae PL171]